MHAAARRLQDLQKVAGGGGPSPAASVSASAASSAGSLAAAAAGVGPHSAAARELRQLQNRLDKATVKANEAYSIRKTYEQVRGTVAYGVRLAAGTETTGLCFCRPPTWTPAPHVTPCPCGPPSPQCRLDAALTQTGAREAACGGAAVAVAHPGAGGAAGAQAGGAGGGAGMPLWGKRINW